MYYIREIDKLNKFFEIFNIVRLKDDEIILPIKNEILDEKRTDILSEKTRKILSKTNSNKIVISKEIKKQERYLNNLYSYNYDIIDGIWLFKVLMIDTLEYIINSKSLKKDEIKITVLVNNLSEIVVYNIKKLIKTYKKVNIVTNHISKFKNIEDEILEKDGIVISVGNNKRKSVSKSDIVLNLDFPTELINKYTVKDDAIIVNFQGNVKINKKRFNGININDYEIDIQNFEDIDYDKTDKFFIKDIYEANLYQKQPIQELRKKIKKDNVKIKKLYGVNSII